MPIMWKFNEEKEMKIITITTTIHVSDEGFEKERIQSLLKDIESGEYQRDLDEWGGDSIVVPTKTTKTVRNK